MLSLPDIAIGAIVAAIITGILSLLGLIISKEQKISEFRQQWINDLRSQVSAIITHTIAVYGSVISNPNKSSEERWPDTREDVNKINDAASKLRLLLNEKEADSQTVLLIVEQIEKAFMPPNFPRYEELTDLERKLVSSTRKIMKTEWNRVRDGELTFRIAKFLAIGLVIFSILLIIAIIVKYIFN